MQQMQKPQVLKPMSGKACPRPAIASRPVVKTYSQTLDKPASASTPAQPFGRIFNFSAGPANLPLEVSSVWEIMACECEADSLEDCPPPAAPAT